LATRLASGSAPPLPLEPSRGPAILHWRMKRLLILGSLLVFGLNGGAADRPPPPPSSPIAMIGDSITYQGDWIKVLGRADVTNLKPDAYPRWAGAVTAELTKLGL
jgi:hypothetical protein